MKINEEQREALVTLLVEDAKWTAQNSPEFLESILREGFNGFNRMTVSELLREAEDLDLEGVYHEYMVLHDLLR